MKGLCAICTADAPTTPVDLDGNSVLVDVCDRCNDEHPRYGGYSFDSSRSDAPPAQVSTQVIGNGLGNSIGSRKARGSL